MINFKLSETEACAAVSAIDPIGNYRDDAMIAFIKCFGSDSVHILHDCMHDQHDDAWNALGALEFWAKA